MNSNLKDDLFKEEMKFQKEITQKLSNVLIKNHNKTMLGIKINRYEIKARLLSRYSRMNPFDFMIKYGFTKEEFIDIETKKIVSIIENMNLEYKIEKKLKTIVNISLGEIKPLNLSQWYEKGI